VPLDVAVSFELRADHEGGHIVWILVGIGKESQDLGLQGPAGPQGIQRVLFFRGQ